MTDQVARKSIPDLKIRFAGEGTLSFFCFGSAGGGL